MILLFVIFLTKSIIVIKCGILKLSGYSASIFLCSASHFSISAEVSEASIPLHALILPFQLSDVNGISVAYAIMFFASNSPSAHFGTLGVLRFLPQPLQAGLYFKISFSLFIAISLSNGSQSIIVIKKCPPGLSHL